MVRHINQTLSTYSLDDLGLGPKKSSERVEKLRQEREALGLRRRELYAHDDDWPKLQELAAKLQRKRERDAKRAKG